MQERLHCGSSKSPTPIQAKQNARLIFLGKNPGAVVKKKNALQENDKNSEEFILAKGLAPTKSDTEEVVPDEEKPEEELTDDDLPLFNDSNELEEDEDDIDEPEPAEIPEDSPASECNTKEEELQKFCEMDERKISAKPQTKFFSGDGRCKLSLSHSR